MESSYSDDDDDESIMDTDSRIVQEYAHGSMLRGDQVQPLCERSLGADLACFISFTSRGKLRDQTAGSG